ADLQEGRGGARPRSLLSVRWRRGGSGRRGRSPSSPAGTPGARGVEDLAEGEGLAGGAGRAEALGERMAPLRRWGRGGPRDAVGVVAEVAGRVLGHVQAAREPLEVLVRERVLRPEPVLLVLEPAHEAEIRSDRRGSRAAGLRG